MYKYMCIKPLINKPTYPFTHEQTKERERERERESDRERETERERESQRESERERESPAKQARPPTQARKESEAAGNRQQQAAAGSRQQQAVGKQLLRISEGAFAPDATPHACASSTRQWADRTPDVICVYP